MSEPIDLGAIYDFFTNDVGGARFQVSVIAQVSQDDFPFRVVLFLERFYEYTMYTLVSSRKK